ncbi:MAG: hypothetical protein ACE5LQ_02840 [Candidatus Bipolaricaulia bacterium]
MENLGGVGRPISSTHVANSSSRRSISFISAIASSSSSSILDLECAIFSRRISISL